MDKDSNHGDFTAAKFTPWLQNQVIIFTNSVIVIRLENSSPVYMSLISWYQNTIYHTKEANESQIRTTSKLYTVGFMKMLKVSNLEGESNLDKELFLFD